MKPFSADFWKDRSVFVTGHTGFKGSWLILLLNRLGAQVTGYSLPSPVSRPSLFVMARLCELCTDVRGDIRDASALKEALKGAAPSVLIHMAAQPLVRLSVTEPLETLDVNVMGTANVLQTARAVKNLQALISVTSDKCYDNREVVWPYRECDPMGGKDPYSVSKGCAELITASFAKTYFSEGTTGVVSVRAGNVIGGGDWAADRLLPDLVRAATSGVSVGIRSSGSVRPWQHVLDPLAGYLLAAERAADHQVVHDAWNFGPNPGDELSVAEVVRLFNQEWPVERVSFAATQVGANEAGLLRIDNTKAKVELGWRPILDAAAAIRATVSWYRAAQAGEDARELSNRQISDLLLPTPC